MSETFSSLVFDIFAYITLSSSANSLSPGMSDPSTGVKVELRAWCKVNNISSILALNQQ